MNALVGFEVANAPRHTVVCGVLPIDTGVTLLSPGAAWSMLNLNVNTVGRKHGHSDYFAVKT